MIQQHRWALVAAVALAAAVSRPARAQSAQPGSEWTTPTYRPPPTPANPPPTPTNPPPAPTNPPPAPANPPPAPANPPPAPPGPAAPEQPTAQPPSPPGDGPAPPATPGYAPGYRPQAYVPPRPPAAPPEPIHAGFFLRLHLGPGVSSFSTSGGTSGSTQVSGSGISLGLALGGALAPNFAVYGTFFETIMTKGNLKTTRADLVNIDSAGLGGFGAGAIYYFEPINLYVSGTLAVAALVIDDAKGKTIDQTGGGFGFQAMVGKEWWVSEHWGLGAAAEIITATSMKDQNDTSVHWSGEAFNVVFSASYF